MGQRRFSLEATWLYPRPQPTPDSGGSTPGGPEDAGRAAWLGRAGLGGVARWPAAPPVEAPSAPW